MTHLLELYIDGDLAVKEEVSSVMYEHRKKMMINMGNAQPFYWELVTYRKSKVNCILSSGTTKIKVPEIIQDEPALEYHPAIYSNKDHIDEILKKAI